MKREDNVCTEENYQDEKVKEESHGKETEEEERKCSRQNYKI